MVTIDLAVTPVREANERIRACGGNGEDVTVVNPDARHHIGVGLTDPIHVHVEGSAGYFCAGLTDRARFEVDNNVGWGLGDNMYSGSVVVRGNAGAIAGVGIRGAELVVHGNIGSRAGQVMKEGTLLCGGNANFMAGYMMYGGRIIILGSSGERVGEDMTGGTIFVGGDIPSLGSDAEQIDMDTDEQDSVMEFLDRYGIKYKGTFKKIVNAGKKLRYGTAERQMRRSRSSGSRGTPSTGTPRSRKTSISSPRAGATESGATAARGHFPISRISRSSGICPARAGTRTSSPRWKCTRRSAA